MPSNLPPRLMITSLLLGCMARTAAALGLAWTFPPSLDPPGFVVTATVEGQPRPSTYRVLPIRLRAGPRPAEPPSGDAWYCADVGLLPPGTYTLTVALEVDGVAGKASEPITCTLGTDGTCPDAPTVIGSCPDDGQRPPPLPVSSPTGPVAGATPPVAPPRQPPPAAPSFDVPLPPPRPVAETPLHDAPGAPAPPPPPPSPLPGAPAPSSPSTPPVTPVTAPTPSPSPALPASPPPVAPEAPPSAPPPPPVLPAAPTAPAPLPPPTLEAETPLRQLQTEASRILATYAADQQRIRAAYTTALTAAGRLGTAQARNAARRAAHAEATQDLWTSFATATTAFWGVVQRWIMALLAGLTG